MEEEIVRLEEQVAHFRQDLYREAVCISSSKMKLEHLACFNNASPNDSPKLGKLMGNAATSTTRPTTKTLPVPGE